MSALQIPGDLFGGIPEGHNQGVRIIKYDSQANEIVRSKIILQYHLFSLLVEGKKAVHTTQQQLQIDESQFLLLTSGHYLMTEKTTSPQGGYQSVLLFFTQEALSAFFAKYPGIIKSAAAGKIQPEPVQLFTKDDFLKGFIRSLCIITGNGHPIPAGLQQLKLEELLLYLCHKHPQQIHSLQALAASACPTDTIIKKLAENNIENNITIEELAFLCNMSLSTFKRKFLKIYGIAPGKWFLQKRMEHAATLLRLGTDKPSDIYYKVGYESHSSFTHSFRQVFGITPSEYVGNRPGRI